MSGYSGTPLAVKLGIKPAYRIKTRNAPADYRKLLAPALVDTPLENVVAAY